MPGEALQRALRALEERGVYIDTWVRLPRNPDYVIYTCGKIVRSPLGDPRAGMVMRQHVELGTPYV